MNSIDGPVISEHEAGLDRLEPLKNLRQAFRIRVCSTPKRINGDDLRQSINELKNKDSFNFDRDGDLGETFTLTYEHQVPVGGLRTVTEIAYENGQVVKKRVANMTEPLPNLRPQSESVECLVQT